MGKRRRQYPMSLLKFLERFGTEEACREHLFHARWNDGFRCPRCSESKAYSLAGRHLWQCAACGYQASVTAGTVMHRSHLPLTKWFMTLYLVAQSKRGISALELAKKLDVGYRIAWALLHKVRAGMIDREGQHRLGGLVELDDAYVGGVSDGRVGRGTTKVKTVVAVSLTHEGYPAYAKVTVVPDFTRETVSEAMRGVLEPGATALTDGLGAFNGLTAAGFVHRPMPNPQLPEGIEPCPYVHTVISNAKAWIAGTFHGLGPKYMQAYLTEFCYRYNRRRLENRLFDRLLYACAAAQPVVVT
jgi:transposase-like protein